MVMESSTATIIICRGHDISLTSTAYDVRWIIPAIMVIFMYQYLVVTKLVDTCIVVVANQPKKPIKQGARWDAGVG